MGGIAIQLQKFPANNKNIMQPRKFSTVNSLHYMVLGYLPQSELAIFKMIFANFKVINKLSEQDIVQGQGYQKQQNIAICTK